MADNKIEGTLEVTGNVGIGVRPHKSAQLYIKSSTSPGQIYIENGGSLLKLTVNKNLARLGANSEIPLDILTNDEPRISMTKTGNVGIGTTGTAGPGAKLEINGDLKLQQGVSVNEFSNDNTLNDNSDLAVPTEKAVREVRENKIPVGNLISLRMQGWIGTLLNRKSLRTYVDGEISQVNTALATKAAQAYVDNKISEVNTALTTKAELNGSDTQDFKAKTLTVQDTLQANKLQVSGGGAVAGPLTVQNDLEISGFVEAADGFRVDGKQVIDANAGWHRSYGNTGWYNNTHGGGWYMTDANWIRSYGNKGIYHNTGILRTDGTLQVGPNGNRLLVNTAGNVGIGTTNSSDFKLNIGGTEGQNVLHVASDFGLRGHNRLNLIRFGSDGDYQVLHKASGAFGRDTLAMHVHRDDAFGVYSSGLTPLLEIKGGSGDVYAKGNVGIGLTPGAKLDVAGALKLSSPGTLIFHQTNESGAPTEGDGFRLCYDNNFFGHYVDALVIEKTDGNHADPDGGIAFVNTGDDGVVETLLAIRGSGNVGIGTTGPNAQLVMTNQAVFGGNLPLSDYRTDTITVIGTGADISFEDREEQKERFSIYNRKGNLNFWKRNGNRQVARLYGQETPDGYVAGNFLTAGRWLKLSDIQEKKDIHRIKNALSKVLAIEGVTYLRKVNGRDQSNQNNRHLGLIAQEVEKIMSEAVVTGFEGLKAIDYGGLIGLLIEGIKEQNCQLEELNQKVNALQANVSPQ